MIVMSLVVLGIFIPAAPGHIGNYHHFARLGFSLAVSAAVLDSKGMAAITALHGLQTLSYIIAGGAGVISGGLGRECD